MVIKNNIQAARHAHKYMKADTLVVSSTGDIQVNDNVVVACKTFEKEGKTFFILKGERKKSKKDNNGI